MLGTQHACLVLPWCARFTGPIRVLMLSRSGAAGRPAGLGLGDTHRIGRAEGGVEPELRDLPRRPRGRQVPGAADGVQPVQQGREPGVQRSFSQYGNFDII